MNVDVKYGPAYAMAIVTLDHKEMIEVESGAMVGMSPDLEMETGAKGGFLKSIGRSMFGGESFFLNTYTASSHGDIIAVAVVVPKFAGIGDVVAIAVVEGRRRRSD